MDANLEPIVSHEKYVEIGCNVYLVWCNVKKQIDASVILTNKHNNYICTLFAYSLLLNVSMEETLKYNIDEQEIRQDNVYKFCGNFTIPLRITLSNKYNIFALPCDMTNMSVSVKEKGCCSVNKTGNSIVITRTSSNVNIVTLELIYRLDSVETLCLLRKNNDSIACKNLTIFKNAISQYQKVKEPCDCL